MTPPTAFAPLELHTTGVPPTEAELRAAEG